MLSIQCYALIIALKMKKAVYRFVHKELLSKEISLLNFHIYTVFMPGSMIIFAE